MGPTGRQYGLKINDYVDERQDPIRSTLAAVRYLKELYRLKQSWYLALAAYNAGPGRVRRAMRRGGSKNYWRLTKRRHLPRDTREYVPQFLAILTIGKNLEKYNFVENVEKPLPSMELVKVPSPVKFDKISEVTGVSEDDINSLNAHLLKDMTPPGKNKYYPLWVPKHKVSVVSQAYDKMNDFRIEGLKARRFYASRSHSRTRYHRVRRGQNLSFIARRYGTSVEKIKKLNGLKRSRIFIGQRLKIRGHVRSRSVASKLKSVHRVRRGENLSEISKRYGVSLSKLKSINGLKSSKIFVGQRIKLLASSKSSEVGSKKQVKRYKIRRGDNLYKIAKKFGMTIGKIKEINNLSSNVIKRGQYLKVASN